jgi:DNA-binding LacI/PurR family transcriptional regulator
VEPAITTMDQPSFEMGRRAAELLINTIENGNTETKTIILDAPLLIRQST